MELTCLMCFGLIVLAGFVGGGIIHARSKVCHLILVD